jgi:hypothetical protein
MPTAITLVAAAVLVVCAAPALAQSAQDHAAHHPEGASSPVAAAKKPAVKTPASKPKAAMPSTSAASAVMGGANKKPMHDEMHKPGGMHDQMHKGGQMMGGMPAASAASR